MRQALRRVIRDEAERSAEAEGMMRRVADGRATARQAGRIWDLYCSCFNDYPCAPEGKAA